MEKGKREGKTYNGEFHYRANIRRSMMILIACCMFFREKQRMEEWYANSKDCGLSEYVQTLLLQSPNGRFFERESREKIFSPFSM